MSAPLPEGWTGNNRIHHRTVGPFRATVYYTGGGIAGNGYSYRVEYVRRHTWHDHDFMRGDTVEPSKTQLFEADRARQAAMDYLRQLATDVLAALG